MTWQIPLLLGALAGFGLFLIIRTLLPASPDLGSALERLSDTSTPLVLGDDATMFERIGLRARKRFGARIPGQVASAQDMALVGKEPHLLLGEKIVMALVFLVAPLVLSTGMAALGTVLPFAIPIIGSLALAVVGWFVPDLIVQSQSTELREEFAQAASIYLDLISIARISGAMPHEALRDAALIPDSWPFRRISQAIASSEWDGRQPWDALDDLSEAVGVPALSDVADIMRLSGESGASVYEALRGRAKSLRNAQLAEEHARENAATERLTMPATLPVLIVIVMVLYPSLASIAL